MDGKGNTLAILRALNQEYLAQTLYADTLDNKTFKTDNDITLHLYPAACACARYSSVLKPCTFDPSKTLEENIATMPWYLPACGELGYSIVRRARIQYAMSQVGNVAAPSDNTYMWSSSEESRSHAWFLTPSSGFANALDKSHKYRARPFAAF